MILIQQCDVYAPEAAGRRDVLVAGGRVVAMAERIPVPDGLDVQVVPAEGLRMIPGLIDCHVHIAGAGGEGGPATRTPEMQLSQMLEGGVTSVVGCLGTDGMTRSVASVLMKCKGLRQEGVSAWMLTGAYQVPTPTVLGDVGKDVAMIDEVIGVGEIAISDHRSSGPTIDELIRLTEHARVGGMLGGKAGVVNFHMGDAEDPFRPLYEIVERSELSLRQLLPTHCNRNGSIFKDAATYGKHGYLDITASSYEYFPEYEVKPSKAIVQLVAAGVPLEHITMTSDGCGSLPDFDEDGNLVKLETGQPSSVLREILATMREEGMPLEQALRVATANVADILKLPRKGRIAVGYDADLVVLDGDDQIRHLVANGTLMVHDGDMLVKGTFER
jgi:beta-aspartyl-dipeptidase (metallo-type)